MSDTPADPLSEPATERNRRQLGEVARHDGWFYHPRPQSLAEPLYRVARGRGGRAISEIDGVRVYVDRSRHGAARTTSHSSSASACRPAVRHKRQRA